MLHGRTKARLVAAKTNFEPPSHASMAGSEIAKLDKRKVFRYRKYFEQTTKQQ